MVASWLVLASRAGCEAVVWMTETLERPGLRAI
jgi:hypothetical protein